VAVAIAADLPLAQTGVGRMLTGWMAGPEFFVVACMVWGNNG